MSSKEKQDPNSPGYTNALLEDMGDKIQVILEATQPIPDMQKDIRDLKERTEIIEGDVGYMRKWEENINLIPAIFEEVGSLRKDVEVMKEAMKLLDRHDERLDAIEKRLTAVEQHVQ